MVWFHLTACTDGSQLTWFHLQGFDLDFLMWKLYAFSRMCTLNLDLFPC
jgi:hypothetical protein